MSGIIESCSHTNEIVDERSGDIICQDCGLVIDVYYFNERFVENENRDIPQNASSYLYEVIDRLHVPESVLPFVYRKINEGSANERKKPKELFLAKCLYKTLCEINIPFSVKDISAVTGLSQVKLCSNGENTDPNQSHLVSVDNSSITVINKEDILERACAKLELNYKTYTLIKETLDSKNNGFNPSTVISAYIYLFCKKNKIKISLKKISNVTGISCMSIQRFIKKNDLS